MLLEHRKNDTKCNYEGQRILLNGNNTKCDGVLMCLLWGWCPYSNVCPPHFTDCNPINYHVCGVIEQVIKHTVSITNTLITYWQNSGSFSRFMCQIPESPGNHYRFWGWLLWSNFLCIVVIFMLLINFTILLLGYFTFSWFISNCQFYPEHPVFSFICSLAVISKI